MKVRILTSIGIAIFGLPILFLSEYLVYPIAISLLALVALFEMSGLTGYRNNFWVMIPAALIAAALPIFAYYATDIKGYALILGASLFLYKIYLFAYTVLKRGKVNFSGISAHFVTVAYITASFTALCLVRYIENGVYYFALVFVASWVCDVFAYFVGRAFGRHKLIPEISPKKTVEGAIGGVVCTTLCFVLYGFIISRISEFAPKYFVLAIFGFVLSVVAQLGDLIASLMKREFGIKDFGKCFPGHGGVMDRTDSTVAVAPVLLAAILILPPFYA